MGTPQAPLNQGRLVILFQTGTESYCIPSSGPHWWADGRQVLGPHTPPCPASGSPWPPLTCLPMIVYFKACF